MISTQQDQPELHLSNTDVDLSCSGKQCEQNILKLSDRLIHYRKDRQAISTAAISYCLFRKPYDRFPLFSWSKICRETAKFEHVHSVGDGYFMGYRNRWFFRVSSEDRNKLCMKVLGWWQKYAPCRASMVPPSPVFAYASNVFSPPPSLNVKGCSTRLPYWTTTWWWSRGFFDGRVCR